MSGLASLRRLMWVGLTLLSHYRRHPAQTAFLIIGLVTGVGLWSAVQIINSHARASYAEADQVLGAQASHWVRATDGGGVDPDVYIQLRRAGFTRLYPIIETRVATDDGEPLWLIATDLLALPRGDGTIDASGGGWLALTQPPYQTWFPPDLANALGVAPGDTLTLSDGHTLPPAVLQSQQQQGRRLFMDIGAALDVLERDRFSYLAAAGLDADTARELEAALPAGLRLEPNRQRLDLTQLTKSLHTNLTAMSLLSFAVGLFIVFNAVRYALLSRSQTFHTLRELGASSRQLSLAILLETGVWSLIGTGLGLAVGFGLSQVLLPPLAATLQSLYGAVVGADILLRPRTWLLAWGMTLAGLMFALALPLWQESRQSVQAARNVSDRWVRDRTARRRLAWAGLILALAAVVAYSHMTTIMIGFVVLGLALFAAACCLPVVLGAVLGWSLRGLPEKAWRLRWAFSDGGAQLPTLRIAMMALLLALTANLGVETLVGSFRTALTDWLDQRLAADLYLQRDSLTREQLNLPVDADWLAASHQRVGLDIRWQGRPTGVRGLEPQAPDSQALPLVDSIDRLSLWYEPEAERPVILANEQVRHLAGIEPGQTVTLDTGLGERSFDVVGFVHDYGNPYYQFYLPRREVERLWPGRAEPQGLALWLSDRPDAEASAEAALLAAGAQGGDWIRQARIKTVSLRIFDRTFAITAAMNGLTLGVAGLALLTALLAIHQQRLPDYAHWRSLGVRYWEMASVLTLPLAIIALLTWLASMPLGALLSWLLIHDLNVLAFGWTMALDWDWLPAIRLGLLTVGVVVAALAVSLWRLHRQLPEALRRLGGQS